MKSKLAVFEAAVQIHSRLTILQIYRRTSSHLHSLQSSVEVAMAPSERVCLCAQPFCPLSKANPFPRNVCTSLEKFARSEDTVSIWLRAGSERHCTTWS
jgi:hypothetical protein